MNNGFDLEQLTSFERDLLRTANDTMPRETKKFLRSEGTKLRRKTIQLAKSRVGKKTGNYYKSLKRGKVYKYHQNGALSVRVYSNAPHAHLIEKGHRQVTKDGVEVGWVDGKHILEDSNRRYESEFNDNLQEFIDDTLERGLT